MMLTTTQADTLSRLRGQLVSAHGFQHPAPGVGGLKVRDLAQDLRVSRQAVVGALGELIARGLVVRHVSFFKGGPATYSAVDPVAALPALAQIFELLRAAAWPAQARALRHLGHREAAADRDEPSLIRQGETPAEKRHRQNCRSWGFA